MYLAGFIWGIFPYMCLIVMIVGTFYRYQADQLRWTSKSSELLEKRLLIVGSVSFHIGILFVFIGHVLGLLVPVEVYNALGISSELYHAAAIILGGLSGLVAFAGISILLYRRIAVECVRIDSDPSDYIVDSLLWIVVVLGLVFTLGYNLVYGPYEYRTTVGPWIRSVLALHPDVTLMAGVPVVMQVHIALAFLLFGISPFTRLIHIYSFPIAYLRRAPLLYRARYGYGSERLATSQRHDSKHAQPRVHAPAAPAEEPSLAVAVDEIEHALVHVTEPVRWLWQRPHAMSNDRDPHAVH